ncbi:hypothetical protein D3C72_1315860 [compost metagenome]
MDEDRIDHAAGTFAKYVQLGPGFLVEHNRNIAAQEETNSFIVTLEAIQSTARLIQGDQSLAFSYSHLDVALSPPKMRAHNWINKAADNDERQSYRCARFHLILREGHNWKGDDCKSGTNTQRFWPPKFFEKCFEMASL